MKNTNVNWSVNAVLDSNIILRLLAPDVASQRESASSFLDKPKSEYFLSDTVFAEIIWVLTSFYEVPKGEACEKMRQVLTIPSIKADSNLLELTLSFYEAYSLSYIDAYSAAVAYQKKVPVASFDKDFKKIPSITSVSP